MNQQEKDAQVRAQLVAMKDGLRAADEALMAALGALDTPVDPPEPLPWTPTEPDGTAYFAADYETDTSPWVAVDREPNPGAFVVADTLDGKPVARAFVPSGGRRAELSGAGAVQSGPTGRRYYAGRHLYLGHSVLWPEDFPHTQQSYHVNMQLHSSKRGANSKSSAIGLSAKDDVLRLASNPLPGGSVREHAEPLRRGVWLHVVHRLLVNSQGEWEAWIRWDDEQGYRQVIAPGPLDVLTDSTDYAYWKLGVYRSSVNTDEATVFHARARAGETFESVRR